MTRRRAQATRARLLLPQPKKGSVYDKNTAAKSRWEVPLRLDILYRAWPAAKRNKLPLPPVQEIHRPSHGRHGREPFRPNDRRQRVQLALVLSSAGSGVRVLR